MPIRSSLVVLTLALLTPACDLTVGAEGDAEPGEIEGDAIVPTIADLSGRLGGSGWLAFEGVRQLLPEGYTFKVRTQKAADALGTLIQRTATRLRGATGLRFAVDLAPKGGTYAIQTGDILVELVAAPCNNSGSSCAGPTISGGVILAGHMWMNSEWYASVSAWDRNAFTHEAGHAVGLDHCDPVKPAGSVEPQMCGGGFADAARAGQFTAFDIAGLATLARNAGSSTAARVGPIVGLAGKCLHVASQDAGALASLDACGGGNLERAVYQPVDDSIRFVGRCLGLRDGATAGGTRAWIADCNGGETQAWIRDDRAYLRNAAADKVLAVRGGATADGTAVQIEPRDDGLDQRWALP